jgi:hypothetical protein
MGSKVTQNEGENRTKRETKSGMCTSMPGLWVSLFFYLDLKTRQEVMSKWSDLCVNRSKIHRARLALFKEVV